MLAGLPANCYLSTFCCSYLIETSYAGRPSFYTGGLLDDNSTRHSFQHSFRARSTFGLVVNGSPKVHPLTPDFNLKGSTTFVRMSARRDRDLSTTRVDGLAYGSLISS